MLTSLEQIREIVKPIVEQKGLVLYDLLFVREGIYRVLRVFIENYSGSVSIDVCTEISREVDLALDSIIDEEYNLEVTSPGLDRHLRDWRDYTKFKDRNIKFVTHNLIYERRNYIGKIVDANKEYVVIKVEKIGELKLVYSEIAKAQLVLEF